jgi:Tol biopolymer transport system component
MPMASGTRLGQYEILAALGAGGMGEVYRARDTKLKRDVALKVLPETFADDSERMARFQREAEVLALLNHPNIAHIYGVEDHALVMELVEGESPKGPLPFEDAWKIAMQIADALGCAHDRGIVHRDLKPANVKVTPEGVVKLLDFGLAKAAEEPSAPNDPTNSPTLTISPTRAGVILGTAPYMSPEQVRGAVVDKRADIWAFGCVLYEMLTGKRAFHGETTPDILAAVLKEEPDWRRIPAKVQLLLRRCLEKDPKHRLRDIGDAMGIIENAPEVRPASSRLLWTLVAVAAVFCAISAVLAFLYFREKPPVELIRFQIPGPEANGSAAARPALSPNGRIIAFVARGPADHNTLWVRSLDALAAYPLSGTEDVFGTNLFWSPDSRFIGFSAQGKLKKVSVSGGPPQTLCDFAGFFRGGAWSRNGVIIFGDQRHGLMRVSESGGTPSPLTIPDSSRNGPVVEADPAFLPDGRHFVYRRDSGSGGQSSLYVGSLDARPEQQSSQLLMATESNVVYAPSGDSARGYLLFGREGSLMAQPFDNRRMAVVGEAVPISEGFVDSGMFSASENGILAYRTGSIFPMTQLEWFDQTGKMLGAVGEPGLHDTVALSPDGTKAAVAQGPLGSMDIWVYDLAHGTSQRLTFDPATDFMGAWSPDGSRIAFASNRNGAYDIYQKASSGVGSEDLLLKTSAWKYPYDWSPDGRWLVYGLPTGQYDLWLLPLAGEEHRPVRYLASQFPKSQARFSPDGRYVAYTSNESGKNEVYVQTYPEASAGKW